MAFEISPKDKNEDRERIKMLYNSEVHGKTLVLKIHSIEFPG
jgi:hypothetical protein